MRLIITGTFNSVTEMIEHLQSEDHPVTVVTGPNTEAAVEVWWCLEHRAEGVTPAHDAVGKPLHDENVGYCWYAYYLGDAEDTTRCRVVAAALTSGATDD